MAITAHAETEHGLPQEDAEALKKIARLAREGKPLHEIEAVIRTDYPNIAEETLDAYHALREERKIAKVKELMR